MSRPEADTGNGPDERIPERILRLEEFVSDLNAQGYTDVLVLRRENSRDVLTESRIELVGYLECRGGEVESVRGLTRRLDHDKGAVSNDLRRLAELNIVEYEGDGDGEPKRPVLKPDHILVELVVY